MPQYTDQTITFYGDKKQILDIADKCLMKHGHIDEQKVKKYIQNGASAEVKEYIQNGSSAIECCDNVFHACRYGFVCMYANGEEVYNSDGGTKLADYPFVDGVTYKLSINTSPVWGPECLLVRVIAEMIDYDFTFEYGDYVMVPPERYTIRNHTLYSVEHGYWEETPDVIYLVWGKPELIKNGWDY